ncbi:hypothetical protein GGD66_002414 [Bradyrhizobium sp. CIR48]|uniref:serine hydrolase domain-containing protein n=1 Tax=Bradyrhizobium sp. CIR48 TaxID=2663840 RepID=UPI0017BE24DA|nr:serine hydrolase [Bradyrhizobium sp. CIR48]MBB4423870.1 hypothetical protein [Bradyrhizobium sp. CIR48]
MNLPEQMFELDGKQYPNPQASDPRECGWMLGSPPPADKRISFESSNFRLFPRRRWSFSHMRELAPTVNVWRGPGAPSLFERYDRSAEIDEMKSTDLEGRTRRFDEALIDTYADGMVVLHRGRIVYERYFGALEPHLPHHCMSITKSYAGTLAASFLHEGELEADRTISHYVPELRGSGWEDATVRQVMDMQVAVNYREDRIEAWSFASGSWPRPASYAGPATLCDYMRTVKKEGVHGEVFDYKTVNTDVLAWVLARVTGRSFTQLLQERLWAPLGCEQDGYITVDPAGTPSAGGGLFATLRDVARFGELMRREGDWNGKQLIPASVVSDIQRGDDPAKLARAGYTLLPGYSYRSMWWISHNELGAFEGRGSYGQRMYIAPKAEMVAMRFSSHPLDRGAGDGNFMPHLLALAGRLRE